VLSSLAETILLLSGEFPSSLKSKLCEYTGFTH
jgi:hypothetical protein